MIGIFLHIGHAVVLLAAAALVVFVLSGGRRDERSIARLREAAARSEPGSADGVVALAEARARAVLAGARGSAAVPSGSAVTAGLACTSAAVVHGAVCPEHFREGWRFGVFFLLLAVTQLGLAVAVSRRPEIRVLSGIAVVNLGAVALWAATRVVSLPFGLAGAESIGRWDLLASAAEVVAVTAAVVLRRSLLRPVTHIVDRPLPARVGSA